MYHYTIGGSQPYGLSLGETLLPEHLSALGYANHHVGKWHLGFFRQLYTPVFRGFSSHFGYWTGRIDYYDHTSDERVCCAFSSHTFEVVVLVPVKGSLDYVVGLAGD